MPEVAIKISDLFKPKFDSVLHDILDHRHTHYTFKGGRGGAKSSEIGTTIPLLITQNPKANAVCFRRYQNTLKDSVYAEIIEGIVRLGLEDYFRPKSSPMEIVYIPTGQRIMFRGLDDPMKTKSIKVPRGYIAITWWEELDTFQGREQIDTALRSTMRGGDMFWNFESFNPPITAANWANKDVLIERDDRLVVHSTYLDVPKEWLGNRFIIEAEHVKRVNPESYRHIYLGEVTGTGGNVFKKIEERKLSDSLISKFDRIYQGLDWGWFPHQMAFVRFHYDSARETIYFIDELYGNFITNEEVGKWIIAHKYDQSYTICDSAEPKSINDLIKMGIKADGALKWDGSVDYGMKWLQGRRLVIDPARTPNVYREFTQYEYERDRQGNFVTGYPDKDDHTISATRYAPDRLLTSNRTRA